MQHFLEISDCSQDIIESLLERALHFKYQGHFPHYGHCSLANLFYENSTRTRVSFEMAAHHLSMPVINLDLMHSSEAKGETIEDTVHTLAAMGLSHIVIRHKEDRLPQKIARAVGDSVHIINAGDGQHAHPSQALLDLLTIREQKPNLSELKIVILGDILHSRVANSLQALFKIMGVGQLVCISPKSWQPNTPYFGEITTDLNSGLKDADVIICLRVQKERFTAREELDLESYRKHFALRTDNLVLAKKDAMIMHPGPVNHDVELDSVLVHSHQSFILQQVKNGVFMRMAILESLIE